MKKTFEFYVMRDIELLTDGDKLQEYATELYINGIDPIDYCVDTLVDENDKVVMQVVLLRCAQRWRGAFKRVSRLSHWTDAKKKYNGRPVFG